MLVIDADTSVAHDSLNRVISACTDDSKIIGICGETKLENENESWWTMIQGEKRLIFSQVVSR
jgi:chitin synthase